MSRINGFIGRRELLKWLGVGGTGVAATAAGSVIFNAPQAVAEQPSNVPVKKPQPVSPDAALKRLLEGNKRFAEEKRQNPHQSRVVHQDIVG